MNENHDRLCSSPEWAQFLQSDILPALTERIGLGARMLEVGPGPGAATDWLRDKVDRLVALEYEPVAAGKLRERFAGTNVQIVHGDATAMTFADNSFDSAGSFTMLHHVPTKPLQNMLFAEVLRVLRPGGVFVGSDSLPSDQLHHFHDDDVYNPIEPGTFYTRLETLGFSDIELRAGERLSWIAYKPQS